MADMYELWGAHTRWSLIREAANEEDRAVTNAAWAYLIDRYREPVMHSLRRMLGNEELDREVVDDFFAYVYDRHVLSRADRGKGMFRCFIQGVILNYARELKRSRQASSRKSGSVSPSFEDPHDSTPAAEEAEEALWARVVLDNAIKTLLADKPRDGALLLRSLGVPPFEKVGLDDLCKESGLSRNALHQAVHRAKEDLRSAVLREVIQTVSTPAELVTEKRMIELRLLQAHPGLIDIEDS